MSNRSTTRNRTTSHPTHTHTIPTPPLQRTSSRPGSSRPGTPSRGDIPYSRKSSSSTPHKSLIPLQHQLPIPNPMTEQSSTPTPKKPRRPRKGNKPSQQRNVIVGDEPDLGLDQEQEQEPSSEDEEMLFDLLGVTSPPKPSPKRGVINLSKDDMDIALGRNPNPRKGRKEFITDTEGDIGKSRNDGSPSRKKGKKPIQKKSDNIHERGANSEGDLPKDSKPKRGKKGSKLPNAIDGELQSAHLELGQNNLPSKPKSSGISVTKPKNVTKVQSSSQIPITKDIPDSTFDTSSLSKSLPSRGLAQPQLPKVAGNKKSGKKNGSEDESAVWEMPSVAGGQELTWQQKLQSSGPSQSNELTPSKKSNKSTPSDKKKSNRCVPFQQALPAISSPLNPRPNHNRRASVDDLPSSSTSGGNNRIISAFDSHIPFHTGYNVHRAPQTPSKSVASFNGNTISNNNNILPIVGSGEFPRLREHSFPSTSNSGNGTGNNNQNELLQRKGSLSGTSINPQGFSTKYAGPTFHNSPNANSLSKPDLEDF